MPRAASPGAPLTASAAPIVAIVVTHLGPHPALARCLRSLSSDDSLDGCIVVDNSGADTAAEPFGPGVDVVLHVPNDGLAAAWNVALAEVRRRFGSGDLRVALVNDDAYVEPGWLRPLTDELDRDPELGGVQPKLLVAGSSPRLVNSLGVALDRAGAGADIGHGEPDRPGIAEPHDVDIVTGGAAVLRDAFLRDVGGFDERYFLYYEDVDVCLRGAERGWRFRCVPASVVWHEGGLSASRLGDERRHLQERNRLWIAFRFLPPDTIARGLWLSVRRLRHPPRRAHTTALLQGIAAAPQLLVQRRRTRR